MSAFLSARCDHGLPDNRCPHLHSVSAISLDVLARRLLAAGWTIDDIGRTYCPDHAATAAT